MASNSSSRENNQILSPGITNRMSLITPSKAEEEKKVSQTDAEITPKRKRVAKREQVLSWDDYFMSISFLSAMRSKDPSTQVGACIVNEDNRIVGIGYNGFPRGCSDDDLPWDREGENELETKYPVRGVYFLNI